MKKLQYVTAATILIIGLVLICVSGIGGVILGILTQ